MKIALASDVHLEFGEISFENTENADVLILSGDICVAADLMVKDDIGFFDKNVRSEKYHKFFQECGERFPHVIYIMGNHEHYNGDYRNTITTLRDRLSYIRNLHILDKDTFVIDDVTFIGGTLWTDMNKEDPITLMQMSGMMNDFRCVYNSHRMVNFKAYEQIHGVDNREKPIFKQRAARFTPEDAVEDHKQMMDYIRIMIEGKWDQKFVVVGHHAPSKQSTHPRYKEEVVMNGGYSSDLDDFIIDHPQIKLWTHGHTHEDFDYMIGSTRIVCNPRGYIRYEDRADRFELKFLEI
jgi:Icc-related predicted phosphoesterase